MPTHAIARDDDNDDDTYNDAYTAYAMEEAHAVFVWYRSYIQDEH